MNKERLADMVTTINCALELEKKIVGVKFLFGKEEYEKAEAREISNKMNYCVMVKMAMSGKALKSTGKGLACIAGARAIGVTEIDDYHKSGQNGKRLGLYRDMATAKSVRDGMSYCDHNAYGVMVQPLHEFNQEPDVVMMVASPYNVMRIVQAYSYYYGIQPHFKMTGNQAVCSESTAYPYLSNDINVSLLCIGTRHRAGWKDDEMAVSFPFNRLENITEGILATLNIMENNKKKGIIEKKLDQHKISDFKIRYDHNYYDDIVPNPGSIT
jgi:uncharacterized protein (DUF169 family)